MAAAAAVKLIKVTLIALITLSIIFVCGWLTGRPYVSIANPFHDGTIPPLLAAIIEDGKNKEKMLQIPALLFLGLLSVVIQWVAFIPAFLYRTEHFYDLTGSCTYVVLILCALYIGSAAPLSPTKHTAGNQRPHDMAYAWTPRQILVAAMVLIWALRLGSFLFLRVRKIGKDGRFDKIKVSPSRFFVAWTIQGLWVFLTALGALIMIVQGSSNKHDVSRLSSLSDFSLSSFATIAPADLPGFVLWTLGFGIEVIADWQKNVFNDNNRRTIRADSTNSSRSQHSEQITGPTTGWIDTGLWRYSRHPNYFGEILLWCGVAAMGIGSVVTTTSSSMASTAASTDARPQPVTEIILYVISPLFVSLLLLYVSGIPLLEDRADKKWGHIAAYQQYKRRTPVLIPNLFGFA